MAKQYDNPEAFKQALMVRLRDAATSRGLSLQDMQIKFLIERLLANPGGMLIGPFRIDPAWDNIRELPRFERLLEKYGVR